MLFSIFSFSKPGSFSRLQISKIIFALILSFGKTTTSPSAYGPPSKEIVCLSSQILSFDIFTFSTIA